MGIDGMRNLFENNEVPGVTPEEALKIMFGDNLRHVLPALESGLKYKLIGLSDGRTAVTVEHQV